MNIAEHKLNLFHQLDNLPEESLLELEQVISTLKTNNALKTGDLFHFTPKPKTQNLKTLLASWSPLEEDFPEIEDKTPVAEDFSDAPLFVRYQYPVTNYQTPPKCGC